MDSIQNAETLVYSPPSGSTLEGGQARVALSADGYGQDASGTAVAYSPEYAYDSSNVFFQCAAGLTPCAPGSNDYAGTLALPVGRGGSLYLSAGCGGDPGQACDAGGSGGAWSQVELYSAALKLANTSTPTSGGFAGTLLGSGARGVRELTFTASDPNGPGVYRVEIEADGQTLYAGTPDTNSGTCVAVGKQGAALMFDSSQPCRQSESVNETLDTSSLKDGAHTLKVLVIDAAQNRGVVYDATITTLNAPESTSAPALTLAAGAPGSTLQVSPGTWAAPAGAGPVSYTYAWQECDTAGQDCETIPSATGTQYTPSEAQADGTVRVLVSARDDDGATTAASTPLRAAPDLANGVGASEHAQLSLLGPSGLHRNYWRSAFTLTGRLSAPDGATVANATVEISQLADGTNSPRVLAYARTNPDGMFTVTVPGGPSRLITVGYRAFSADRSYSTSATVSESVAARITLSVTPRRAGRSGRIRLAGHVAGPIPGHGVLVELLVYYRAHWEPFRDPRTDRNGRFTVTYSFQGAEGVFPFRAEVAGGQAGFPYSGARSTPVTVRTG